MNKIPLLQKTLGADWDKLSSVIQQHYIVSPESSTCIKGKMEIDYPNFLQPLIFIIHLFGGLVFKRGNEVITEVRKTSSAENTELCWKRTMFYPDNKKDSFYSRMMYLDDHQLIEKIRFGFGLRHIVSVDDGNLIYRSNGYTWQCGKAQLIFPDWLLLGEAIIVERPISDQQFSLNFSIKHPLWGVSYWYKGEFYYC